MTDQEKLGFLRTCMDRRFVQPTRTAFEQKTGLGPNDYWHEAYAGGAAVVTDATGENYAAAHGATIFGWQAHGDNCGGQPGVSDQEIQDRLDRVIREKKRKFHQGKHYRIFATEKGIDIKEV